jgi:archaeal preflagellin peptidase FlaK
MFVNIPLISIIIAIAACAYASYSDLKLGLIQNKLTFPLIAIGIILNGIYVFYTSHLLLFIEAIILTAIIFVIGWLFWKIGAWAGGDVKLFTAVAALIPFYATSYYPTVVSYQIFGWQFPMLSLYPFAFTLIINSILSMLPFLLIFVFYIAIKHKPELISELISPLKDYRKNLVLTLVISSAVTITLAITMEFKIQIIILSLILMYLLTLIISKTPNKVKAVIISVVTVYALFTNYQITISGIIFLFISITVIEILKKLLTSVSRKALHDEYEIEDLKEGMISAYNIYENDDEAYADKTTFFSRMKEGISKGDVSKLNPPHDKLVVSSMAAGLSKENIEGLIELKNKNKIENKLEIKRGVPFAPSILIGLLISLFIGDIAFIVEKILVAVIY